MKPGIDTEERPRSFSTLRDSCCLGLLGQSEQRQTATMQNASETVTSHRECRLGLDRGFVFQMWANCAIPVD